MKKKKSYRGKQKKTNKKLFEKPTLKRKIISPPSVNDTIKSNVNFMLIQRSFINLMIGFQTWS